MLMMAICSSIESKNKDSQCNGNEIDWRFAPKFSGPLFGGNEQ
jgi:hypothetical protein